jgi:plasmid replication initiation protein
MPDETAGPDDGGTTPAENTVAVDPVDGEIWLYRLVKVTNCKAVDGEWQFQSSAFSNSTHAGHEDEMSIVLGDTLGELQRKAEDLPDFAYPDDSELWGVAKLRTDCVRAVEKEQQEVARSPTDKEQAHGDVLGSKKRSKTRKELKKCATWVVPPGAPPR